MAAKRGLTLDLKNGPAKRTRLSVTGPAMGQGGNPPPILTTPDVQMLKMSSPEMAKFLNANNSLATPTPSGIIFPKTVTEEQELYAKGFEVALEKLHEKNHDGTISVPRSGTAISTIENATNAHRAMAGRSGRSSSDLDDSVEVKQEMDDSMMSDDSTLSSSRDKLSPIDMESQEKIKLERKRQRNRLAASKCRKRKLERISQLDDKVQKLKMENNELAGIMKKLKESICNLKQEVMNHMNSGCQVMLSDMSNV